MKPSVIALFDDVEDISYPESFKEYETRLKAKPTPSQSKLKEIIEEIPRKTNFPNIETKNFAIVMRRPVRRCFDLENLHIYIYCCYYLF